MMRDRRIGVLGGTFDPIHLGHLAVAEAARSALDLDEVLIVPAHDPPHRQGRPQASGYHRFAMVAMAVLHRTGLIASDLELVAQGVSYTSATLQRLRVLGYQPAQLFFIAGADAFAEIASWHGYPAILERAHFAVVSRPGVSVQLLRRRLPDLASRMQDVPASAAAAWRSNATGELAILLIDAETPDISSTSVRRRVTAGQPLSGYVPQDVDRHIARHRLYLASARPHGRGQAAV